MIWPAMTECSSAKGHRDHLTQVLSKCNSKLSLRLHKQSLIIVQQLHGDSPSSYGRGVGIGRWGQWIHEAHKVKSNYSANQAGRGHTVDDLEMPSNNYKPINQGFCCCFLTSYVIKKNILIKGTNQNILIMEVKLKHNSSDTFMKFIFYCFL